jgi:type IV pilus assembly protein PilE
MHTRERGFSLIELMIAVSVMAILTVIAVPSYRQYVIRSHREDATAALLRLAAQQEKFYIQNNRYATYAELGSPPTENGWYTLTVPTSNATTFTARATVVAGGSQDGDPHCQVFTVNAEGQHLSTDPGGADSTDLCW